MLNYLPDSLYFRTFKELDISNNLFLKEDLQSDDHIHNYMKLQNEFDKLASDEPCVTNLSHLSFYILVQNSIKFKRQDIPRTLWPYFNVVGRCAQCCRFVLPDYVLVQHTDALPRSLNLVRNQNTISIPWQSLTCRSNCK